MNFVIEIDGKLFGPFENADWAVAWAIDHKEPPWTVRPIHIVPQSLARGERRIEDAKRRWEEAFPPSESWLDTSMGG
jgi:hypothetical protein